MPEPDKANIGYQATQPKKEKKYVGNNADIWWCLTILYPRIFMCIWVCVFEYLYFGVHFSLYIYWAYNPKYFTSFNNS